MSDLITDCPCDECGETEDVRRCQICGNFTCAECADWSYYRQNTQWECWKHYKTYPENVRCQTCGNEYPVPWSIAEQAYSVYSSKYGRGQSLERLAERGGFGHGEMDMWAPEGWHQHFRVRTSLE